jgi:L,D-transpeptidase catalytic domain
MRIGSWLFGLLVSIALLFAAPAQAAIVVNVSKSNQILSITVDGTTRYVWPVSTGRPGFDTPNGTFKVNRMDANHLSQEWDNAPMPHTMFFDMHGHAIHGFFDVKHLGSPVSHGCVRLAPANAAVLFALVQGQGMSQTAVVVSGQAPARGGEEMARRHPPAGYDYQPPAPPPGYFLPPRSYYAPQRGYNW